MDTPKVRDKPIEGTITYRFPYSQSRSSTLYINLIANYACTNECLFCGRPKSPDERGKPNIFEQAIGESLYLPRSPSLEEVMDAIAKDIKSEDKEIAFVGLGEPLLYLDTVLDALRCIKSSYDVSTRVDTNGHVRIRHPDAAKQLADAGLDKICISVNAINEEEYNQLCRPIDKNAYQAMLAFLRECISEGIETKASFISGFFAEGIKVRSNLEYLDFARSLGLRGNDVLLRQYAYLS